MDNGKYLTRRQLREILRKGSDVPTDLVQTDSVQINSEQRNGSELDSIPINRSDASKLPLDHRLDRPDKLRDISTRDLTSYTYAQTQLNGSEAFAQGDYVNAHFATSTADDPKTGAGSPPFATRKMRRTLERVDVILENTSDQKIETTPVEVIRNVPRDEQEVPRPTEINTKSYAPDISLNTHSLKQAAGVVWPQVASRRNIRHSTTLDMSRTQTHTGQRHFDSPNHSVTATSGLVISTPNRPTEMIADTGDVFHTSTVSLPRVISQTGGYTGVLESNDLQDIYGPQDFSIAPVSASRAICTSQTTRHLFSKPKRRIFWKLFIPFLIGITVLIGVGLFVFGVFLASNR